MAQFDLTIHYVKGERNVVANALSRHSDEDPTQGVIAAVSTNTLDRSLVLDILTGYTEDPFCCKLLSSFDSIPGLVEKDGLLYLADRLIVPRVRSLWEKFFQIAHDAAGHFGTDKTYTALQGSFIGRTCAGTLWKPTSPHVSHACITSLGQQPL